MIDNPKATEQLVIGEYYYVDFHPVPKPKPPTPLPAIGDDPASAPKISA